MSFGHVMTSSRQGLSSYNPWPSRIGMMTSSFTGQWSKPATPDVIARRHRTTQTSFGRRFSTTAVAPINNDRTRSFNTDHANYRGAFDIDRVRAALAEVWRHEEQLLQGVSNKSTVARVDAPRQRQQKEDTSGSSTLSQEQQAVKITSVQYGDSQAKWHYLDREMSSNMAGETGAVFIYRGARAAALARLWLWERGLGLLSQLALASLSQQQLRERFINVQRRDRLMLDFVSSHLDAEQKHLDLFKNAFNGRPWMHTRLLPLWRVGGLTLGFTPAFFGGGVWLYHTVEAVETFVEGHYNEQIRYLHNYMGNQVPVQSVLSSPKQGQPPAPHLKQAAQEGIREVENKVDVESSVSSESEDGKKTLRKKRSFQRQSSVRRPGWNASQENSNYRQPSQESDRNHQEEIEKSKTDMARKTDVHPEHEQEEITPDKTTEDMCTAHSDVTLSSENGTIVSTTLEDTRRSENVQELVRMLRSCCEDEIHHKDDAQEKLLAEDAKIRLSHRFWRSVVFHGSATAATIAKYV
ncbi:unnamed protein product [Amoebophrya sp. A25]|nr:unnamed protein product [Amoebophrya sp. A25]|eukprot:GSA25T00024321001.1